MAYTATKLEASVEGNYRVWHGVISADAASGTASFALGNIVMIQAAPKSASTAAPRFKINLLADGLTSSPGTLGISGCTSGDDFYVTVYGR